MCRAIGIEAADKAGYSEGTAAIALRVLLLQLGNVSARREPIPYKKAVGVELLLLCSPGYILKGHRILDIQAMTLALDLGAIYQDAGIGRETGKGHHNVVVEHANLAHGAILLKLGHRLLLHAEDHAVGTANSDLQRWTCSGLSQLVRRLFAKKLHQHHTPL